MGPPVDPTKFINSFSEAKVDYTKPEFDPPTLVLNDKTVDLKEEVLTENVECYETLPLSRPAADAERHKVSENKRDRRASGSGLLRDKIETKLPEAESVASVSSKWDREDVLSLEYPEIDHPLVKNLIDPEYARELDVVKAAISGDQELPKLIKPDSTSGPQNVLRKALANMEKDNLVRDKKRKSLEGSELGNDNDSLSKKKKKKKKKIETEDETSEEESRGRNKKKNKEKKAGLEIPEKTLKKLLKKNLLKKKALEKL